MNCFGVFLVLFCFTLRASTNYFIGAAIAVRWSRVIHLLSPCTWLLFVSSQYLLHVSCPQFFMSAYCYLSFIFLANMSTFFFFGEGGVIFVLYGILFCSGTVHELVNSLIVYCYIFCSDVLSISIQLFHSWRNRKWMDGLMVNLQDLMGRRTYESISTCLQ